MAEPLSGLRVVEFGQLLAGPYVGDAAGRLRRRRGQGRGASGRRPDARLGPPPPQRPLAVVVGARAQQAQHHPQPAHRARPGDRRRAGGDGRRGRRELPPRHDGEVGAGAGRRPPEQPARDLRARLRLRPDRPLPRPPGLRQRRRGDRRPAAHQRLPRPGAAAQRHQPRRHAGRPVRVPGDPARALRAGRQGRDRPGGRRLDHRRLLRHARVDHRRVREDGRRAPADRPAPAAHRAVQRLPAARTASGS